MRPLLDGESNNTGSVVEAAPASSQITLGHDNFCDFDAVFGPDVSQKELYAACLEDLVTNFFEGWTIFALSFESYLTH